MIFDCVELRISELIRKYSSVGRYTLATPLLYVTVVKISIMTIVKIKNINIIVTTSKRVLVEFYNVSTGFGIEKI